MELDAKQLGAIDLCLDERKRIVAVTGPAGTGKTTIIQELARRLSDAECSFAVCAPTGKAARRITEATGVKAVTIHRLLEYPRPGERDPKTGKVLDPTDPKRDRNSPLFYDVVIADEYMMVPHDLDRNLIDALGRGRLLVFGDVNQLPPIDKYKIKTETEAPFERHIKRASVRLDHIYRQTEGSGILINADRIRVGAMPTRQDDFQFFVTEKPVEILMKVLESLRSQNVNLQDIQHQIIVPTRKTWIGTNVINQQLKILLNGDAEFDLELPRNAWDAENKVYVSIGDKVVCTENTYDMRSYDERYEEFDHDGIGMEFAFIECPPTKMMLNGETGMITEIRPDGTLEIDMGDRIVEVPWVYGEYSWKSSEMYDVDPRKRLELAYALTTHKCQGSEYRYVIYVINKSCAFMLNRRNYYTAVTRAREHVIVITDQKAMRYALRPEHRK